MQFFRTVACHEYRITPFDKFRDRVVGQGLLEVGSDYSCLPKVGGSDQPDLIISRRGIDGTVHEPGIPICSGIHYGRHVSAEYQVLGIQGRQDLGLRKCSLHLFDRPCIPDGRSNRLDFPDEVPVDEVLVSLEFCRTVSADTLVPIWIEGIVEYVRAQVGDPVRKVLVLQYDLVNRPLVEMPVELARGREAVGVEIALADGKHVHEYEQAYSHHGFHPPCVADMWIGGIGFGSLGRHAERPEQEYETQQDEYHRPQGVLNQQVFPVFLQCIDYHILHPGIRCSGERSGNAWNQNAEEAEAGGQCQRDPTGTEEFLLLVFLPEYPVQDQEGEHRQGELQDDERHRDCPELVVHRDIVIEQLREPHHMASQGQENCQQGRYKQPPFLPALVQEQSEEEKENRDGSNIHGTGRERLRAPVERQGLGDFIRIPLTGLLEKLDDFGFVRIDGTGGGTSVEIRDHQVGKFFPSIGPGGSIIELQAFVVDLASGGMRQF